ncbi:hypothetical protein A2W67_00930 [Candidatus Nomurabacteria bacterium RIFCSPLOWO2_02_40_28]|uniref:Polymerase nucleotidyl transferase domain-containing protein n=2 Tax=Candidatus Nomuraibacteriota TaxID=1752729 RepID=A0A837HU84_9BACT|nr:MAG: hypothetical protein UT27_C0001G0014 [Candidatus Nomurabacteria bacterium GW2011_GWD2_39_12]KKR20719.1 MAG: hypothetical protein UT51_C0002G0154 [Candidatus Nomurabacteria bacterium GW2011_GWC2_39_41]KKR37353.1 MAG: hypothetical protein UT70_C0001G0029 [Candidatus Nomurabacteria bacterium GW2011_GWE2_40_10]KKR38600.1 MAG: hypothetical protein UT73_C0002G0085 [Candidatus Nomurabacteria bacterium GW2011_GWB1_40_11]KKR40325.1 MAG: hypothetical protein UT74_C0001G0059 [Parcubacteria group b
MSIPANQLDTWAKQGSKDLSSTTYQSVRNALSGSSSPIREMITSGKVKIDLQGSYANDTNTRGDSDVDVLVRLDVFQSNKLLLPREQYLLHEQTYFTADYILAHLRRDVLIALKAYYGNAFIDETGNKSIKLLKNSGRLKADIVPVIAHRTYSYFLGLHNHSKVEGILLNHKATGETIINYPDQHYNNGVAKHQATSNLFKRVVRIIKNARSYAVEKGLLSEETAPSYFLQSLVYNVPNEMFTGDNNTAVFNILKYLNEHDISSFVTQSNQHQLFGTSKHQWNITDANTTINALVNLWDNWNTI